MCHNRKGQQQNQSNCKVYNSEWFRLKHFEPHVMSNFCETSENIWVVIFEVEK